LKVTEGTSIDIPTFQIQALEINERLEMSQRDIFVKFNAIQKCYQEIDLDLKDIYIKEREVTQPVLEGLQLGVSLSLMARTMMENRLGRHRKSRQEERTDGGQISGVRSEHGVRPSLDLGEPAHSLKCKEKRAYKIPKVGGSSIIEEDTW
jgi:hypothetical protein